MTIHVEGEPKEIAALVLELQERQELAVSPTAVAQAIYDKYREVPEKS